MADGRVFAERCKNREIGPHCHCRAADESYRGPFSLRIIIPHALSNIRRAPELSHGETFHCVPGERAHIWKRIYIAALDASLAVALAGTPK